MTTMKPVVVRLYAVLVVLTLVGLVVWAGADWYQQRQAAQAQAQATLRKAAGQVTNLTIPPSLLDPASLGRVFADTLGNDPRWKVVVLSSPERGTEFYRGPRPLVAIDRAVPRWAPHQGTEVEVTLSVFRAGTTPLVLSGIREFYGRGEIFALLKACGVTLVVLLVLTTIMVILSARGRQEEEQDQEPGDTWASTDPEPEPGTTDLTTTDLGSSDHEPRLAEPEDEYWFEDTPDFDLPPLDPPEPPVTAPRVDAEPPSLLAPSGLGWTSFLETRLGQELERSAGQNQDLALVVVRPNSDLGPGWTTALLEAFPSVDLNFEHEDGAALVLPSHSLEAALARAKDFVGTTAVAGVASRNGRLVSASTLMAEAVSALNRARAGGMAVLGLKTDPERWRAHLAS